MNDLDKTFEKPNLFSLTNNLLYHILTNNMNAEQVERLEQTFQVPNSKSLTDNLLYQILKKGGNNSGTGLPTNILVHDTDQILSTSENQTIELQGLNLDHITSISISDAEPINVNDDILIVSDNLIELNLTMNANTGSKELIVNGTSYPNWIESQVNGGWSYLGINDGFQFGNIGIDTGTQNTDEFQVFNNDYPLYQDNIGIKQNHLIGAYRSPIKFNKFKIKGNQTIEVLFDCASNNNNTDLVALGLIKTENNIDNIIDNYGLTQMSRSIQISKFLLDASEIVAYMSRNENASITYINESVPMQRIFREGWLEQENPTCLKMIVNNEKIELYQCQDRQDRKGKLLFALIPPNQSQLNANTDYSFYINSKEAQGTGVRIHAIKITG